MKRALLLLLLAASVALAGCANDAGDAADDADGDGTPSTDPTPQAPPSKDEARGFLEDALADTPTRHGFTLTAVKNGNDLVRAEGTFDNATGESHLHVTGNPAAFAPLTLPEEGIRIYTSRDGAVYRLGDVAVVQSAAIEQLEGIVPTQLLTPQALLAAQEGTNLTVTSVQATTHGDEPALDVGFQVVEGDTTITGTATILQDPARLVRLEANLPEDRRAGAFSGATVTAEMHHGDDAPDIPDDARLLVGLAYQTRVTSATGNQTWTFQKDSDVPLEDLVALVQDPSESDGDISETPAAFQMALADGTAESQGIRLAYDDADGDGLVSQGDTLTIRADRDASFRPQVVLHHADTGAYVTSDLFVVLSSMFGFGG